MDQTANVARPVRQVTKDAYDSIMLDVWPHAAAIVDFGLDSDVHFAALQAAIRKGATAAELDDALGDGGLITALVRRYVPDAPHFRTSYDLI